MPYISARARYELDGEREAETVGELTYLITDLIQTYFKTNGLSYQRIAEVLGALRGAELDLERRIVTPYELRKQEDNGDVWAPELLDDAHGRE